MACKIFVETFRATQPETVSISCRGYVLESTKYIDHDNSSDRKWLGSHCFWAMRNGRRVVTTPAPAESN